MWKTYRVIHQMGITKWTTWGHLSHRRLFPLVLTCLSELKVICSPLFLKQRIYDSAAGAILATSRFAGHSPTAYTDSHVIAGGVVHGSDEGFAPFAPAVLFGNGLAGRGAQ